MTHQQPGTGQRAAPPAGPPERLGGALRRSRGNKVIAGVCGGLGREFDADPVIFRVVLAVLALSGGIGLIAYGAAWLRYPLDGEDENEGRRLLSGRVDGPGLTALLCALVGCGLLLSMLDNGGVLLFSVLLSGAVIGAAHWSRVRRRITGGAAVDPVAAHAVADAPPETQAPPSPGAPSWWREQSDRDGEGGPADSGYLWGPDIGPFDGKDARAGRSRRVRDTRGIGGTTFLLALAAAVTACWIRWDDGSVGLALQTGLTCALVVFGLGLLVSAWFGRTGAGTILNVALTAVLLAAAAALPRDIGSDWARVEWTPANASGVREEYVIGSGLGTLDLSRAAPGEGRTLTTRARVAAGRLEVTVPADTVVSLTVDVGLGDIRLPGQQREEFRVGTGQQRRMVLRPSGDGASQGTLVLRLEAGTGQVEVKRAQP
ncbi:PspC domain-containing protein [Streptomyces meridianus]|uniref:PspC domain-containing protein n=1 Tax=Streptomyces meridianus TaxID=2938945 RepID=A0ABT0X533_9ACTN|nr:PspC domain-containing protein [Streptomyces meridianus]MCM2577643.1 PspC domain-containing protein [Streptomyces meridianus]